MKLKVESAAIRDHDGTIYSVDRPGRHHHVIRLMVEKGCKTPINGDQGFLLSDGQFCRRKPAKIIAENAGQLLARSSNRQELYSEDLW